MGRKTNNGETVMKKVWVGIITYNNVPALTANIESLFNSDLVTSGKYDWYIEIINNHHNFSLSDEFLNRVTVHHQTLRPEWTYTGYFTRDCNSILMRSIRDLNAPAVDHVVILQDDVMVRPDFMKKLTERHESGIEFIMSGIGDAINSFLPAAVKKIGLYDERFQTGFHEGDYILRAIQKLGMKCSISDIAHGRVWNPTDSGTFYASDNGTAGRHNATRTNRADSDLVICPGFTDDQLDNVAQRSGKTWHEPLWFMKWGPHQFYNWSDHFKHEVIPTLKQKTPNFILYPEFERNIDNIFTETYEFSVNGFNIELPLYCNIVR